MSLHELVFESALIDPPQVVWERATTVDGILEELSPLATMTLPAGVSGLFDLHVELGKPIARSWLLLFGVLPVDRTDLTLIELEEGRRFLEESPMLGMKLWRHERTVEETSGGSTVTDRLTFEPRLPGPLVPWFVRTLFQNRHRGLRRRHGAKLP